MARRRPRFAMDRLHIWQKLLLLGVVFAVLFAIPTTLYLGEVSRSLERSTREIEGLARAATGAALAAGLSRHRSLAAAMLAGDASVEPERALAADAVDKALGELRPAAAEHPRVGAALGRMATAWKALSEGVKGKSISAADSNGSHAESVGQAMGVLEALLDADGLSVDPDPVVQHSVRVALAQVPALVESLGQGQAIGMALLAARQAAQEEREAVSAALLRAKERDTEMRAAMRKVFALSDGLKAALAPVVLESDAAVAKAIRAGRVDVIFSQALDRKPEQYHAEQQDGIATHVRLAGRLAGEVRAMLEERASGQRRQIGVAAVLALAIFVAAIALAVWTARSITQPLGHAVRVADGIAAGRLDQRIDAIQARSAEASSLLGAFLSMQGALSALAREIQQASDSIRNASVQVADGNADLAGRTENQASSLEETAATMEELTATVKRNAESSAHATQVVNAASESAMKGAQAVSEVVNTMEAINGASRRIVDIIGVIDSIAFQTNILALNAAVEAARAGEHGRGFAVVASEVRNLARRSADSAREIKSLIAESVQAASLGATRVDETGRAMDDIMDSVRRVSAIFAEIEAASREQRNGIEQVNKAVTQMDRTTQENAALVGEVAASSQALQDQAQRLAGVVARFRLARETAPEATAAGPADRREATPRRIAEGRVADLPRLTAAD